MLQNIGCDYVIDSSAVEDRCGVCHGNGSTCTTVRRTFEESEGLGMFHTNFGLEIFLYTDDILRCCSRKSLYANNNIDIG